MPPVDPSAATPAPEQTPAPDQAPAPVPEPPKKPGFFARLFGGGKKVAAPAVPANFESQPEPQVGDVPPALPTESPVAGVPGAEDDANSNVPPRPL